MKKERLESFDDLNQEKIRDPEMLQRTKASIT